jgi:penicillin amidase
MDTEDTLATVFTLWWRALGRELFEDELGVGQWRGGDFQEAVLADSIASLIDDRRTPNREDAVAISHRAMEEAHRDAAGRSWGQTQTLTVRHPLARVAAVDRLLGLTRGPFPWAGDGATLNAAFSILDREAGTLAVATGPSMRYVMDWSDPDSFTLTPALGQSGHPHSPHFADFLEWSRTGRRWTVPLSRTAADARRASLLRLLPA